MFLRTGGQQPSGTTRSRRLQVHLPGFKPSQGDRTCATRYDGRNEDCFIMMPNDALFLYDERKLKYLEWPRPSRIHADLSSKACVEAGAGSRSEHFMLLPSAAGFPPQAFRGFRTFAIETATRALGATGSC